MQITLPNVWERKTKCSQNKLACKGLMLLISNEAPKLVWLHSLKTLLNKTFLSLKSEILILVMILTAGVPKVCYHPGLANPWLSHGCWRKAGWMRGEGKPAFPCPWERCGSLTAAGILEEPSGPASPCCRSPWRQAWAQRCCWLSHNKPQAPAQCAWHAHVEKANRSVWIDGF